MRMRTRFERKNGAGDGSRTRDPKLGKLVLYQLSYARFFATIIMTALCIVNQKLGTPSCRLRETATSCYNRALISFSSSSSPPNPRCRLTINPSLFTRTTIGMVRTWYSEST